MRVRIALLPLLALAPPAHAEGAQLSLDCISADGSTPRIVIAPVQTDQNGAGKVSVAYDGADPAPGFAGGFSGPFSWQSGPFRLTLLVDAQPEDGQNVVFLLHGLDTRFPGQNGNTSILSCREATG